ncbi:S8 family peptidase [Hymenobacter sediminicola]|uniref:S8 family serine peptidase n=1 Tax=Hymenobacter sediminicola TaxID=2761579 RepID=A0A7G7W477_9BACT|nr:S8 family peptidase [Hymenobacter sediminicola]QNH61170.1 S8 family serine peptidase [Hymenobacter sediminicola]
MFPRLRALSITVLLGCLLALGSTSSHAQATYGPLTAENAAPTTQPGTLVFKLRPEYLAQASLTQIALPRLEATLRRLGATRLRQKFPKALPPDPKSPEAVDLRLIYQVWFGSETVLPKARLALQQTGVLAYVEPLYNRAPLYMPNDPLADSTNVNGQLHLKNIRAYQAWDVAKGDTTVVIGITDTGFRLSHEDLDGQWQRNRQDPPDGIDNDNDGFVDNFRGWDFADDDNNPSSDSYQQPRHGVHTSGCSSARPDNARGLAGVGFNCRFLPLKIYPSTPGGSFSGFEAIVYAADHGCKIINLSWGAAGGRSQFEQDAITYAAVNRDAVVVASAGNTNAELDFYPASYDHVLSVGSSSATDVKSGFATFSRRLDLVAPGDGVLTTWGDNDSDYIRATGSSFSAPLVAGAAGLVRARFPQLNAAQVRAQLRRTTDNIDLLPGNAAYQGKLGTGRLNAYRAVQANDQRAARITQRIFAPAKGAYQPADTIRLTVEVENLLLPVQNLTLTVTSLTPYLTVRQGSFAAGALATLARASNSAAPFRLAVASIVPLNTRAVLRYHFADAATGYEEDQYATILLNPDYVVLNAGDLALTLTSRGNIGYDGLGSDLGESVSYRGGAPLLYEGGLLLVTGATRVSSRLRNDRNTADTDFFSLTQTALRRQPLRADQEASGLLQDSLPSATRNRTVGVQVRQRGFAWAQAPHRDYVILEYQLKNVTPDTLKPLYAGLFMDWDVVPEYGRNVVAWDSVRRLSYAYDAGSPTTYVGLKWLNGGTATCYAINVNAPAGSPVQLSNGFSRSEKYLTLSNGTRQSTTGLPNGTDIAHVLGAALPRLAPTDSAVVAFAVLAAPSLAQLQAAADAAQTRYNQVLPTRPALTAGEWQLYPNPASGHVRLEIPARFGAQEMQLLNPLGQVVRRVAIAGAGASLNVSGLPAGLYMVRVQGAAGTLVRRLLVQPQ